MNKQDRGYCKLVFLLVFMLIVPTVSAQQTEEKVYDEVEKMPQFPGGMDQLLKFLRIPLAREAFGCGVQSRVIIQFIIEKDGTVTHPKVVRSVDPYLDKAALKLFDRMPRWTPGEQGGEKVRVSMAAPVRAVYKGEWELDDVIDKASIESAAPLVLIDGFEVSRNTFHALKLDHIKSYVVVKASEAEKRYGERGKNGVVIITLKSEEEMRAETKR